MTDLAAILAIVASPEAVGQEALPLNTEGFLTSVLGPRHAMRTDVGWTLGPFLAVVLVFTAALAAFVVWRLVNGPYKDDEITARGGRKLLPDVLWEYWFWTTRPVERALLALKVSPNAITAASLVLSVAAGVCLALGEVGFGGWLYVFGGTADIFDGRIARATHRQTRAGAFFDSTLDRWGEMAVLLGLAVFFNGGRGGPLCAVALAASLMVSYVKARGEALGVECGEGGMQRAERIVYLGVACIFAPLVELAWPGRGAWLVEAAVGLIAISSFVTAVSRSRAVYRGLRTPMPGSALPRNPRPVTRTFPASRPSA